MWAGLVCLQQLGCKSLDLDEMHATRSQRNYQQQQMVETKEIYMILNCTQNLKLTEKEKKNTNKKIKKISNEIKRM